MNYTKNEIANFNQKDKRISFLSIFSSLTGMWEGEKTTKESYNEMTLIIMDKAFEITEELYEKYPIIEEVNNTNQDDKSEKPLFAENN